MENKNCKDCLQIENLKNKFDSFEKTLKSSEGIVCDMVLKLQDRVGTLERQGERMKKE